MHTLVGVGSGAYHRRSSARFVGSSQVENGRESRCHCRSGACSQERSASLFVGSHVPSSAQQTSHYFCRNDSGEFLVEPLKLEREFFMVNAEQMKKGGIEIAHVYGITNDVVAKVVRFTIRNSCLHTSSCQPHGEAARMMIATVVGF